MPGTIYERQSIIQPISDRQNKMCDFAPGIERITRNRHDDDNSNADLSGEDEEICPICQDRLGTELEMGKNDMFMNC
jgi:hypothetical protein